MTFDWHGAIGRLRSCLEGGQPQNSLGELAAELSGDGDESAVAFAAVCLQLAADGRLLSLGLKASLLVSTRRAHERTIGRRTSGSLDPALEALSRPLFTAYDHAIGALEAILPSPFRQAYVSELVTLIARIRLTVLTLGDGRALDARDRGYTRVLVSLCATSDSVLPPALEDFRGLVHERLAYPFAIEEDEDKEAVEKCAGELR